jgi:hypothetical protein
LNSFDPTLRAVYWCRSRQRTPLPAASRWQCRRCIGAMRPRGRPDAGSLIALRAMRRFRRCVARGTLERHLRDGTRSDNAPKMSNVEIFEAPATLSQLKTRCHHARGPSSPMNAPVGPLSGSVASCTMILAASDGGRSPRRPLMSVAQ